MEASLDWLRNQVEDLSFDETLFRLSYGENKYIFDAMYTKEVEVDIFAISSIYDTIIDLNAKIKYSFDAVVKSNPSENLMEHKIFEKPAENEMKALYYIENMIFRTSTLWDMLAQLCNVFWKKGKSANKLYTESFFHDYSQGKNKMMLAEDIYNYFKEADKVKGDFEKWEGNFQYVKEYRNKMTHRNSPSITALSNFDLHLRSPAIFILKRVTEDYLKSIEYIKRILDEIFIALDITTNYY